MARSAKAAAEHQAKRIAERKALMAEIAKTHLGVETLETRKSDRLDFHEVAVWQIKVALEEAFNAGRNSR